MSENGIRTTRKGKAAKAIQTDAPAPGAEESRPDIYQRITDRIAAAIEAGAGEWRMPWHSGVHGAAPVLPVNAVTGKPYRGVNTVVLWATAQAEGYPNAAWATYRQWRELGAQVRKGERASPVVFWKFSDHEKQDEAGETSEGGRRSRVFARGYAVFSAAQVDDYEAPALPVVPEAERISHAEAFFAAIGATIRHGDTRACYVPSLDEIRMPPFAAFRDPIAYYATLAHEVTHLTGHPTRCARDLRGRFGDEAYAIEEMIAELGAAFLCADLALAPQPRPDHAAYVASWAEGIARRQAGDLHGSGQGAGGRGLDARTTGCSGPAGAGRASSGRLSAAGAAVRRPDCPSGLERNRSAEKRRSPLGYQCGTPSWVVHTQGGRRIAIRRYGCSC